ncbi:MAG: NlpC/P60 family protein [bacterium]|nr:NlpC/P60 family protein [bacterium]
MIIYFISVSYFTAPEKEKKWRPLTSREKLEVRSRLAETARQYVQKRSGLDCSGLVLKIYELNNITLFTKQAVIPPDATGVKIIFSTLKKYNKIFISPGQAQKGDLIFFNNTFDMNRNNRNDDLLTHIGIIVEKDGKGNISFIHSTSRGIRYDTMNLSSRSDNRFNSYLRVKKTVDQAGTKYLTGELFYCFGTAF